MNKLIIKDYETLTLPDDRQLGYSVYGDPGGKPVLFFHGIPGSRLQRSPDVRFLMDLSLCIYAPDRPGVGLSTFHKHRTLLSWTDDISTFCKILGIKKCAVVGISSGAPYALACAYRMKKSISHVSVISGLAPLTERELYNRLDPRLRILFHLAKRAPSLLNTAFNLALKILNLQLKKTFNLFVAQLPPADKQLLSQPEIALMFQRDVTEALRQGSRGIIDDLRILSRPWGFSLNEITAPVHVWHGTADTTIPIAMAYYFLEQLPKAHAHFVENKGHFFAVEWSKAIFESIT